MNPKFSVKISRSLTRNFNQDSSIDFLEKRIISGSRANRGWEVKTRDCGVISSNNRYVYIYEMTFERSKGRAISDTIVEKQKNEILLMLDKLLNNARWQGNNWEIVKDNDNNHKEKAITTVDAITPVDNASPTDLTNITTPNGFYKIEPKWDNVFDDIYNLDEAIRLMVRSVETAVDSEYEIRPHTLLVGPPACGKTTLVETTVRSLGPADLAYFRLDATSTTKAGIERILLDKSRPIPPIMVIEELEKVDNISILKFLLSLLDDRAEINKINYRVGHQHREVKLLCIATVNDIDKLRQSHAGAVASRFTNQIFCPRPNRDVIAKILRRELDAKFPRIDNRYDWIEPTLDYVIDEEENTDPRRAITVCTVGRDRLLDGSHQEDLRATKVPNDWKI